MIKSFTVTNYVGDSIVLELGKPEKSGFLIESVSGLGPVKADINVTDYSSSDGGFYTSARAEKRNIVFELIFVDSEKGESIEDLRQKTYKYFPLKRKVSIVVETDNRKLETVGYVESNEPEIFSSEEGCQISVICPDSYWYSTDGLNRTVFSGIEAEFEFPFSNESLTNKVIEFGSIEVKTENTVYYTGDAEVGIIINIHAIGSASNITVYNSGTRERIKIDSSKIESITGSGIVAGDDIIITTSKGEKSAVLVRDGKTTNILNCIDKASSWLSLSKGDNLFAFGAETGAVNLQFNIEYKIAYEGV